ncbi:Suppressor of Profilin deletion [Emydomyces testavorans]|uniref:Suppressor of Profilin deletion n=1 Tax=Emydomyces testavorans TaxID=2070801 RepID=A0AAF0DAK9_9EURO|nr:Suppressor of Profilin deletion [Emydomyces testavorans]
MHVPRNGADSKKRTASASGNSRDVLSQTEEPLWAQSHETLAQRIEADVERPLREYNLKNKDLKSMSSVQQDLANLARSLEAAQKKADKLKDKGPKAAGKSLSAASAAQDARAQWDSRVPFVFEQLQAVDEHRLNHLRDVLTQLQTHEADQVERNRQSAENCLNALLTVDTAEEIGTFALRASGGRTAELGNHNPPRAVSPQPETAPMEALQPPPRLNDDGASQRSSNSIHGRPSFALEQQQHPQHRHAPLGGLKRLGTVMARRRSTVQTTSGHASPEKKFRSPFMSFRRTESARNFHHVEHQPSSPNGLAPTQSLDESSQHRPGSSATANHSQAEPRIESVLNGTTIPEETAPQEIPVAAAEPHDERPILLKQASRDADGFSAKPDTIDEISRVQREADVSEDPGINLTIRDRPIQEDEGEAKQAMDEMASTLRRQAKQSGLARSPGSLRGRRDVRNTVFIPNLPVSENEIQSGIPSRTNPETVNPAVSPSHIPQSATLSGTNQDDHTLSDVTSIHSSQTLHSLSGLISHPELHAPGLSASIVEKLTASVSGGIVTQSFVVGELALAYNPTESSSVDHQIVRLDNFQVLERVAANPQFVTEVGHSPTNGTQPSETTDDRKGEYNILLTSLRGPAPAVAFKYQIHLDSSNLSAYCPLIFEPIWNVQEFQASVIINYSLNPQFISSSPLTSIILQNLVLTVNLDVSPFDEETKQPREVARATGAAMHPNIGASFRRRTSSVVWKIPELEVKADGENRFLARFSTITSWPRKGKVEARFDAITKDTNLRLGISSYGPAVQGEEAKSVDPFADATGGTSSQVADPTTESENWTELPTQRKLSVSRYVSA